MNNSFENRLIVSYNSNDKQEQLEIENKFSQNALFVDYYENWKNARKKGIIVPENYNKLFFLSPIDERDKYTKDLKNCFSLIVRGVDENNNFQSLLTHQNPVFLESFVAYPYFDKKLTEQLEKIKDQTNIVDIIVAGGNYSFGRVRNFDKSFSSFYKEHLEILNKIVNKTLGKDIEILTGPNFSSNPQSFYLETQLSRAYLLGLENNNGFNYPCNFKNLEVEDKKGSERLDKKV